MAKKAIDVSSWQGVIDWDAVKADGVEFAVIRGGLGDDIKSQDDTQFERNWKECQRVGIPCTMYLFSYAAAKKGDITGELNHIRRLMQGKTMNCSAPVYIDVENTSGLNWRSISDAQLLDIMKRYKEGLAKIGYKMGIYSSRSAFWNEKMTSPWYEENVSIWVAEYGKAVTRFDRHYDLWQYSSHGSVNGIKGRVDMDWLYADFSKDAPAPEPTPEPTPGKLTTITYQTNNGREWLPDVQNRSDYAGNFGQAVTAVFASANIGNLYYRVHDAKKKRWLPEVKNRSDYAGNIGNPIDGFMIRSDSGTVYCQAHIKGGKWLPPVTGYSETDAANGYAGILGKQIDALYIWVK